MPPYLQYLIKAELMSKPLLLGMQVSTAMHHY
jgi:hypothetical protein